MTAFLFIPATAGAKVSRRVDLADFGSLFADAEDLVAPRPQSALVLRVLALLVILMFAIGDTVLVARPTTLTRSLPPAGTMPAKAVMTL